MTGPCPRGYTSPAYTGRRRAWAPSQRADQGDVVSRSASARSSGRDTSASRHGAPSAAEDQAARADHRHRRRRHPGRGWRRLPEQGPQRQGRHQHGRRPVRLRRGLAELERPSVDDGLRHRSTASRRAPRPTPMPRPETLKTGTTYAVALRTNCGNITDHARPRKAPPRPWRPSSAWPPRLLRPHQVPPAHDPGIYVLQCGDPTGTGTGGPGLQPPGREPAATTSARDMLYPAGTVAMANTGAEHRRQPVLPRLQGHDTRAELHHPRDMTLPA